MGTSKEVTELRKAGQLDAAYEMANSLVEVAPDNIWNTNALAWCLYEMIKRAVSQNDFSNAQAYLGRLESLPMSRFDTILPNCIKAARQMSFPERKVILEAKEKSKAGDHLAAMALYREAVTSFPEDADLATNFAFELQKEAKFLFEAVQVDVRKVRKVLAEYIRLKNERPSILHSNFLRYAVKIIDAEEFNLIAFLKLWDLKHLRTDDFKPYEVEGRAYPSLAEKVIQKSGKLILEKRWASEIDYFLPYLDIAINRFPENIWLPYYKAKMLHLVSRDAEAVQFLIPIVKQKIGEYWTWSLLGDLLLETEREVAISCYCKAILCGGEDRFLSNVRLKLADVLIQNSSWAEAKFEVAMVIKIKEKEKLHVADHLRGLEHKDWFKNAHEKKDNLDYYNSKIKIAEEYIFNSMPWMLGCMGEVYEVPDRPNKPRRKVYLQIDGRIHEFSISDKKFRTYKIRTLGAGIKVKGEFDSGKKFQPYMLEIRHDAEPWDILPWLKGNIVHVVMDDLNRPATIRVAIDDGFGTSKEGVMEVVHLAKDFSIREGMPVSLKYFQKAAAPNLGWSLTPTKRPRVQILDIRERPDGALWDIFAENVGIIDHVNVDKGIAHFIVNRSVEGIVRLNMVNEALRIGGRVLVRVREVYGKAGSYYAALTCQSTDLDPAKGLLREFAGEIEISNGLGFVDGVMVPTELWVSANVKNSATVCGSAILNYNKKKGIWGWKAITIEGVNEGS